MDFLFPRRGQKTFKVRTVFSLPALTLGYDDVLWPLQPRKSIPEGTHRHDLLKHAEATLGSGADLRQAVQLPEGEDLNEWVAVHIVDFFNQISMLYGTITEFCTPQKCPIMSAGPKYEYHWADGQNFKKPIKCSAPQVSGSAWKSFWGSGVALMNEWIYPIHLWATISFYPWRINDDLYFVPLSAAGCRLLVCRFLLQCPLPAEGGAVFRSSVGNTGHRLISGRNLRVMTTIWLICASVSVTLGICGVCPKYWKYRFHLLLVLLSAF